EAMRRVSSPSRPFQGKPSPTCTSVISSSTWENTDFLASACAVPCPSNYQHGRSHASPCAVSWLSSATAPATSSINSSSRPGVPSWATSLLTAWVRLWRYGDGSPWEHAGDGYARGAARLWYGPDDVGIDTRIDPIEQ